MRSIILMLTLACSAGVQAQEWVSVGAAKTAAPSTPSPVADSSSRAFIASPSSSKAGNNELVAELAMQVEQLQQEIAMLRGRLEEQDYQLQRSKEEQQARYLDVDRRLSALFAEPAQPPRVVTVPVAVQQRANDAYQQAMALVREKKYVEANAAFDQFIKTYPQDPLLGNALYWSGEVWLVRGELDKAAAMFKRVVSELPNHDKAADSMYKLGVTLHRQGNVTEAKTWLKRVVDTYAGKADTTVQLARAYLEKL